MKISNKVYLRNLNVEKEVEKDVVDLRTKLYSLDKILDNQEDKLSLALQPELKTEFDLETNMFAPYPQSNIPFSFSTSWIGM